MKINKDDLFIVLASDGLWKVMSSIEVAGFIEEYLEDESIFYKDDCAKLLALECKRRWDKEN